MKTNFKRSALKRIEEKLKRELMLLEINFIELGKDERKYSDDYVSIVQSMTDLKHEILVIELLIIGESIA